MQPLLSHTGEGNGELPVGPGQPPPPSMLANPDRRQRQNTAGRRRLQPAAAAVLRSRHPLTFWRLSNPPQARQGLEPFDQFSWVEHDVAVGQYPAGDLPGPGQPDDQTRGHRQPGSHVMWRVQGRERSAHASTLTPAGPGEVGEGRVDEMWWDVARCSHLTLPERPRVILAPVVFGQFADRNPVAPIGQRFGLNSPFFDSPHERGSPHPEHFRPHRRGVGF
jgi:hypothetical protein